MTSKPHKIIPKVLIHGSETFVFEIGGNGNPKPPLGYVVCTQDLVPTIRQFYTQLTLTQKRKIEACMRDDQLAFLLQDYCYSRLACRHVRKCCGHCGNAADTADSLTGGSEYTVGCTVDTRYPGLWYGSS